MTIKQANEILARWYDFEQYQGWPDSERINEAIQLLQDERTVIAEENRRVVENGK